MGVGLGNSMGPAYHKGVPLASKVCKSKGPGGWYDPTTCMQGDLAGSYRKTRWWFQTFFIFTPIPGEMIQFDEHIFQMG